MCGGLESSGSGTSSRGKITVQWGHGHGIGMAVRLLGAVPRVATTRPHRTRRQAIVLAERNPVAVLHGTSQSIEHLRYTGNRPRRTCARRMSSRRSANPWRMTGRREKKIATVVRTGTMRLPMRFNKGATNCCLAITAKGAGAQSLWTCGFPEYLRCVLWKTEQNRENS